MQIPKIVRRACFCSPKGERKSEDYTEKDGKYQAQMQDFFTSFFVPRGEILTGKSSCSLYENIRKAEYSTLHGSRNPGL